MSKRVGYSVLRAATVKLLLGSFGDDSSVRWHDLDLICARRRKEANENSHVFKGWGIE